VYRYVEQLKFCLILIDDQPGDRILVLDAGGGTIDVVTYEVANSFPLRFTSELVRPNSMSAILKDGLVINPV
jgi:hypothetical protein